MTYAEASAQLTGRNRDSRKIANNTYLKRREEGIAVMLHASDVVLLLPDGGVRYHSHGHYTQTTKNRMSKFGMKGVSVYSKRGDWYLSILGPETIEHPEFYYGVWCTRCRHFRHINTMRGPVTECPECGDSHDLPGYFRRYEYRHKTLLYRDGLIVHSDLSVTGAGPVVHYKQYDNHHDLFFGVFPNNPASR